MVCQTSKIRNTKRLGFVMKITYIKEGMKITHPSGVVQILSLEDLIRLKDKRAQRISDLNTDITRLDSDITKVKKVEHG